MIEIDRIILVDGRVDASGAEPKILVDNVSTDLKKVTSDDEKTKRPKGESTSRRFGNMLDGPIDQEDMLPAEGFPMEDDSPMSSYDDLSEVSDEIPPIPEPPTEWDFYEPAEPSLAEIAVGLFAGGDSGGSEAEVAQMGEAANNANMQEGTAEEGQLVAEQVTVVEEPAEKEFLGKTPPAQDEKPDVAVDSTFNQSTERLPGRPLDPPVLLPPFLVPPPTTSVREQVQMITVVLRSTGDKTRDVLRLRRIHGTIMSYPGNDRFAFHVFERGRGYLLEFPNFTTAVSADLVAKLQALVGADNVRVESITFQ